MSVPFVDLTTLTAQDLHASLAVKRVRAASYTNVTLVSAVENGDTVGGVVLATGDRVALFGQTTASENGIHTVNASGAPTRALDFDAAAEVLPNTVIVVAEGTYKDSMWQLTNDGTITVGTTALVFFPTHLQGTGTPEAVVAAPIGAVFKRTDGGAGTTLYVKESGVAATGWTAVGAPGSGMTQIAQVIVGSAVATIDFTSIPATYRDLMIVWEGVSNGTGQNMLLRMNNDSGAVYNYQLLENAAATITGSRTTGQTSMLTSLLAGTGLTPSSGSIIVPNYRATTLYKAMQALGGASGASVYQVQGVWVSTAAINRLTFLLGANSFDIGTCFTLYGIGS